MVFGGGSARRLLGADPPTVRPLLWNLLGLLPLVLRRTLSVLQTKLYATYRCKSMGINNLSVSGPGQPSSLAAEAVSVPHGTSTLRNKRER